MTRRFSRALEKAIFKKYGGICAICGRKREFDDGEIDHIIPLTKEGSDKPDNLQWLCHRCNKLKGNQRTNEEVRRLLLLPEDYEEVLTTVRKGKLYLQEKVKIDFSTRDEKVLKESLRNYAQRIVSDYESFASFEREGVKPLIEQFSKFDLKKYYVSMSLRTQGSAIGIDPEYLLEAWIQYNANGLFILGDFGSGKSTVCAYIAYILAYGFLKNVYSRIPIFIPLRYIHEISKENVLNAVRNIIKTNWETLSWLLESGKLVFILDGFDEIMNRTSWRKTLSDFQSIVKLICNGKSKVIVTCRTHYFLKDSEIWGDETELLRSLRATKNFLAFTIEPFKMGQIQDMIRLRTKNPSKILNQIWSTYNLRDLCKRPLLIDMIISTLPKLLALGMPIHASTLYNIYTEDWIEREDWRSQLSPEQKEELMMKLAFNMYCQEKSGIHFSELPKLIETEFKAKPSSEVASFFDYDIRTCSFFNRDSEGNYGFMHRSFLEFFVARIIASEINSGSFSNLSIKSLSSEIVNFATHMVNPDCSEVLLNAILETKGKSLSESGLQGGNALKLLVRLGQTRGLEDEDFSLCTIEDVTLSSNTFKGCKFDGTKFRFVNFFSSNFEHCSIIKGYFESCGFYGSRFIGGSLNESEFRKTKFERLKIIKTSMYCIKFLECGFHDVLFTSLDMRESRINKCNIGTRPISGIRVVQSDLSSSRFIDSRMLLSIFHKSILKGVDFQNCDLRGSCISDSDFESSRFERGSLSFASIIGSKFDDVVFVRTRLFRIFMNVKEMGRVKFEGVHVKHNEQALHHVVDKGADVRIRSELELPALCALDCAIELFSLDDMFEERVIERFSILRDVLKSAGRIVGIATCFYSLIKESDRPRTLHEVARAFPVISKEISRQYRKLLMSGSIKRAPIGPKNWVEVFAKELNIADENKDYAKDLIDLIEKEMMGKTPRTLASSAIYFACNRKGERIKLVTIASVANLSTTTIRNASKLIAKIINSVSK